MTRRWFVVACIAVLLLLVVPVSSAEYEITTDFSGVPTSGTVPLTVYFTDSSTSTGNTSVTIDAWSWDFGDGTTSTDQNPAHQYTTSGDYTVTLTATNASYGASWELVQRLGSETFVYSLSYLGGGICLAGTHPNGQVYRSTDYGASWELVQRLGSETNVLSLSYLGGGICLAGTQATGQVYRSTDYGASWELVQRLGSESHVLSLSYLGGGICLAGTHPTGQVYRSTDYGASWELVQRLGSESHVWSLSYLGGGICLAGTQANGQVYRSTDYGASWELVQRLGSETNVWSLSYLGGGICLAGTGGTGRVYRSTDYGASWELVQRLGSETNVWSLSYLGGGICLAGTYPTGQVYRSTDYGASWELVQRLGSETYVRSLSYLGGGICLAGTGDAGRVFRSGYTDTETKTDYITVSIDTAAPSADFVATPLCEDVGDPIYFIDFSTGGGLYAWNWSFGDSSYSELRNPAHSYASNGTYDISLTVWGANGTDTLTKTGYITIPCGAPTPTPTVTPTPTGTIPVQGDVDTGRISPLGFVVLAFLNLGLVLHTFVNNESRNYLHVFTGIVAVIVSFMLGTFLITGFVQEDFVVTAAEVTVNSSVLSTYHVEQVSIIDASVGYYFVFIGILMALIVILSVIEIIREIQEG